MKKLFSTYGYTRWLTGRGLSWFGDSLLMLVLGIWIKTLTGSNALAGLTFAFYALPHLAGPFLGFLIDRFPRERILVIGNLLSILILIPLYSIHDRSQFWLIWLVTVGYGFSGVILNSASIGLMTSIVKKDDLAAANGIQQTIGNVMQLIGPGIGAGLFAIKGGIGPTTVAAVLFLAATFVFATFRNPPKAEKVDQDASLWKEMTAGFRHLRQHTLLVHMIVSLSIIQFAAGFIEGSMYSVTDTFGLKPEWVGVLAMCYGFGMVVGALLSATVIQELGTIPAMIASFVVTGTSLVIAALAPNIWFFLLGAGLAGVGFPTSQAAFGVALQQQTPSGLMGRVSTALGPIFSLVTIGSLSVGAMLVVIFNFRIIFMIISFGYLLAISYLWLVTRRLEPAAETTYAPSVESPRM